MTLLGILTVVMVYAYVRPDLPSVETLKDVHLQTPMKIYSADGLLISQYGEKRRIPLALDEMPEALIHAVLDTEDSRFYDHPGIDPIGIMRAVTTMVFSDKRAQGASTITMQVARNFFLTRERTIIRKVKEIFLSLLIESELSKDEILTLYLNKIPLGHRAFGFGAAAQVYYGKDINELTLAQIATIAGLPKAPSTMNPISRPDRSVTRRAVVLGRMLAMGHITRAEYEQAKNAPVTAKKHGADIQAHAPYLASMINREMIERFGQEQAYTAGYKVYTTVPANLQLAAQKAVMNNLHNYDERHGYRGPEKQLWSPDYEIIADNSLETPNAGLLTDGEPTEGKSNPPAALVTPPPVDLAAWSQDEIVNHLKTQPAYGYLQPAVVTQTLEKSITVMLKDGQSYPIEWDNLRWARPFINDNRQGRRPKTAEDIFTAGAQVWVRQTDDGQYRLSQMPDASGALVAIDPKNGAVRSVVGGYSHAHSQYNRASQAKRQVGSNIKPFIYSAALEHGYTLSSLINDAPIHQWDTELGVAWRPKNSPPVYDGPIRIRVALAKSKNVVSVRLLKGVGLKNVVDHIEKFGIPRDELPENDSLALGSASLTPMQVAAGIASFANGGFQVEPYIIERIVDAEDRVIFQANPMVACPQCENPEQDSITARVGGTARDSDADIERLIPAPRVVSKQNAFLINQAMTSTIWGGGNWNHKTGWNGTGWRAQKLKRRDLSGKTGTTNDARDTWFSGYNSELMVTTWVGFDNPSRALGRTPAGAEAGARTAQPAWVEYMQTALKDVPNQPLKIPEDIVSVRIDEKSGLLATRHDHTSRFEYFIRGTEPTQYATEDTVAEVHDNDGEGKVSDEEEIF